MATTNWMGSAITAFYNPTTTISANTQISSGTTATYKFTPKTFTVPASLTIGDVELTEDVARKLVDIIEQLERPPEEMDALVAGIAQEADCSEKEARITLIALRSLLSLAAIERKLEAV